MKNRITLLMLAAACCSVSFADTATCDTVPESRELEQTCFQSTPTEDIWWRSFNDSTLLSLIERAVANNFNAAAAQKRIEAARQTIKITEAGYYPTLGVSAGWNREGTSADMQTMKSHSETMSYFNLGLTMNWEIDVFGRIMAQANADKENYQASIADYDATLVSLCSNLAKAYFRLRMAQAQLEVSEKTILNDNELLRIAETRHEVGLVPSVDVLQAEIALTQAKAMLPSLKADISSAINQISVLTAENPEKLRFLRFPHDLPTLPAPLNSENSIELLRRRPDIAAAERRLAATAAQVGIAKKDFLPTLSLTAGVGTEAHSMKNLFGSGSLYYQVMPTLSWTIFDGMARKASVAQAKATMEAELESYNLTVMTAVNEVNDALSNQICSAEETVLFKKILKDARKELELQVNRYKQGLCGYTDVANAQNVVLQYENKLIQSEAQQLADCVTLYTALGGGY